MNNPNLVVLFSPSNLSVSLKIENLMITLNKPEIVNTIPISKALSPRTIHKKIVRMATYIMKENV